MVFTFRMYMVVGYTSSAYDFIAREGGGSDFMFFPRSVW